MHKGNIATCPEKVVKVAGLHNRNRSKHCIGFYVFLLQELHLIRTSVTPRLEHSTVAEYCIVEFLLKKMALPTMNNDSSIPELINFIRHSFLECEFNQVQNVLMEREKNTQFEMEKLVRDCDDLKKELDLLENTQSFTVLERCNAEHMLKKCQQKCEESDIKILQMGREIKELETQKLDNEEKLVRTSKKCEEFDEMIIQMRKKIEKLESEKSENEEKLIRNSRKCKETDVKLVKMAKEVEVLGQKKLYAYKTIEELKVKGAEADQVVQELKRENGEALQTIGELRAKLMDSNKAVEVYKSRFDNLDPRILMMETSLVKMFNVNVEDLATLSNWIEKSGTAANSVEDGTNTLMNDHVNSNGEDRVVASPEVPATSVVRNLDPSASNSAVDGSKATVHDNEGQEPGVGGAGAMQSGGKVPLPSSDAREAIIVLLDSDSDDETRILHVLTNKRGRRECGEKSPVNSTKRRRIASTSTKPSRCSFNEDRGSGAAPTIECVDSTDSEDDSCSDTHTNNLFERFERAGRSKKD